MLPTLLRRRPRVEWPLAPFDRDIDRMFNQFASWVGENGGDADLTGQYPVDIREDDQNIYVDAELPGFTRDQVNVTLESGILTIAAERKEEKKTNGKQHLHERRFMKVERSFTLPAAIEESKVDAKLEGGVLHLTIKKTKESQPRKVAIK